MIGVFIVGLLILWLALAIIGAIIKAAMWLIWIAIVGFLVTFIVGMAISGQR
jgi:hypothetical protein